MGHLQCVVCEVGEGFLLLGVEGSDVEDGCTKKRFRNLSLCFKKIFLAGHGLWDLSS